MTKDWKELNEKEKERLKGWGRALLIMGIFSVYRDAWVSGNRKQKTRMVISWILFSLVIIGISLEKNINNEILSKRFEMAWLTVALIWVFFCIWTWLERALETKKSEAVDEIKSDKELVFQKKKADPTTIWILFILFGWSYGSLGKIGLQILYYLTAFGLGIWYIIRLFTLQSAIRNYNRKIAIELGFDDDELISMGYYPYKTNK